MEEDENQTMKKCHTLTELYEGARKVIVTAHRGACHTLPENTIPAFERAVKVGADIIEFDVRMTADGIPVLLHDKTIDRTSNGKGEPGNYTLSELKKLDFSTSKHGERVFNTAAERVEIPSLDEVFIKFRGVVCMNIQMYVGSKTGYETVCRLFKEYDMYDYGYLTIADWNEGNLVKSIDPKIEICMTPGWLERSETENLIRCRDFGCRFVQPVHNSYTKNVATICREVGLIENVFYADDNKSFETLINLGARGILTNRCEVLCKYLKR